MKHAMAIGECMVELSGGAAGHYRLGFAGDTFNTAYYLRRQLPDDWRVGYLTALGDDLYSDRMADFIAAQGIDTTHIARLPGLRPGLYAIHQQDGDRHFTYWRDNAAARRLADDAQALTRALDAADLIYFSGITLGILAADARERLLGALSDARAAGSRIAFDPNIRPALWSDGETLANAVMAGARVADFVFPTHADEAPYFGDADDAATLWRYLQAGASEVVVKNGGDPAIVGTREAPTPLAIEGERVETVVDATGAGDSFNAGYLAARMGGADPAEAVRAGHRLAARVIGVSGALLE